MFQFPAPPPPLSKSKPSRARQIAGWLVLVLLLSITFVKAREIYYLRNSTVTHTAHPRRFRSLDSKSPRYLFFGNSNTFVNDLPNLFQWIAYESYGQSIEVEQATEGGAHLGRMTGAYAETHAPRDHYDVIFAQPASLEVIEDERNLARGLDWFEAFARQKGARLRVWFSWLRGKDDPIFKVDPFFDGKDPAFMEALNDRYLRTLRSHTEVPWISTNRLIRSIDEDAHLRSRQADDHHASVLGTYAAALALARLEFGAMQESRLWFPETVPEAQARVVSRAVEVWFAASAREQPQAFEVEAPSAGLEFPTTENP